MYFSLYHNKMSIFEYCYLFILKSILSDVSMVILAVLWMSFSCSIVFLALQLGNIGPEKLNNFNEVT